MTFQKNTDTKTLTETKKIWTFINKLFEQHTGKNNQNNYGKLKKLVPRNNFFFFLLVKNIYQGPVAERVVSLMSSLRVIALTVLADSVYSILIFFAEKMWVAFAVQKLLTFFQQKISAYLRITLSILTNR